MKMFRVLDAYLYVQIDMYPTPTPTQFIVKNMIHFCKTERRKYNSLTWWFCEVVAAIIF